MDPDQEPAFNFNADPDPESAIHFNADPDQDPAFQLMRIRIRILIKVIRIYDYWSTDLQGSILRLQASTALHGSLSSI